MRAHRLNVPEAGNAEQRHFQSLLFALGDCPEIGGQAALADADRPGNSRPLR